MDGIGHGHCCVGRQSILNPTIHCQVFIVAVRTLYIAVSPAQNPSAVTLCHILGVKLFASLMCLTVHCVVFAASASLPSKARGLSISWMARYFGGSPWVIGVLGPITYRNDLRYPGSLLSSSRCSCRYQSSKSPSFCPVGSISTVSRNGGAAFVWSTTREST